MPELPDVVLWSIPAFVLLMLLEAISFRIHPAEDELGYDAKDTATSISMGLGSLVLNVVWGIVPGIVYAAIYTITPLRTPTIWPALLACLVAYDFLYYWSHRVHHVVRILWASHVVHHSSQRFNLSTALRQTWTGFTSWLFYLPLVALGVHPVALAFCGSVNLVYQFWIHTERVGKLPRPVESLFNTPSHHRVHHGSQGSYLDRNFGGILIVWDRLFGSFAAEVERPVYGLTTNITTHNLARVALHEYASIGREMRAAKSWRQRVRAAFGAPNGGHGAATGQVPV